MTDEEKKLLETFETKLRHLLFLHDQQLKENAQLRHLLDKKDEELKRLMADNNRLERQYSNLKSAMTISLEGSDVKETKQRLSKLVREVDKCIALLNQ
ncbi:MAG: hypothetical protein ACI4CA_04530 [Bacteroides sp.]